MNIDDINATIKDVEEKYYDAVLLVHTNAPNPDHMKNVFEEIAENNYSTTGTIYKDRAKHRKPFKDFEFVRTSRIHEVHQISNDLFLLTSSNTKYLAVIIYH